jgi:hypothetical protein
MNPSEKEIAMAKLLEALMVYIEINLGFGQTQQQMESDLQELVEKVYQEMEKTGDKEKTIKIIEAMLHEKFYAEEVSVD